MSLLFLKVMLGREIQSTVLSSDNRAAILHQHINKRRKITFSVISGFKCFLYSQICIAFAQVFI